MVNLNFFKLEKITRKYNVNLTTKWTKIAFIQLKFFYIKWVNWNTMMVDFVHVLIGLSFQHFENLKLSILQSQLANKHQAYKFQSYIQ